MAIQDQIEALRSQHSDPATFATALEALLLGQQNAFDTAANDATKELHQEQERARIAEAAAQRAAERTVPASSPTTNVPVAQFGRFQLVTFSGEEREDHRAWLEIAELKFSAAGIDAGQRVAIAMDALRKEAQAWFYSEQTTIPFSGWADFKLRFSLHYNTELARERICRQLANLKFDGNYSKYITNFRLLSSRLHPGDMSIKDQVRNLTSPLPVETQIFVYQREVASIQDALDALQRYDSLLRTVAANRNRRGASAPNLIRAPADTGTGQFAPMEIDRLAVRTMRNDRAIGPCWNCDDYGHLSAQCPRPRQQQNQSRGHLAGRGGRGGRQSSGSNRPPYSRNQARNNGPAPQLRHIAVAEQHEVLSLRQASVELEDQNELFFGAASVVRKDDHLTVIASVRGELVEFLLDTGANANFISPTIADRIGLTPTGTKRRVRQAFSDGALTDGQIEVDLYLQPDQPWRTQFHVAPITEYDGILGLGFMRKHRATPDWENNTCAFGEQEEPAVDEELILAETQLAGEEDPLQGLLASFDHLFAPPGFSPSRPWDHQIDTGEHRGTRQRDRPRSPLEHRAIQAFLQDGLANGTIVESASSPWASPLHLVLKPSGEYRVCVDYRVLNSATRKNAYPLVRIDDCYQFLQGAKVFSTLDLKSGYWQVRVAEEDRHNTAFICRYGLYEFTVMPFGLCNAPATFQHMMNSVLAPLLDKCALVYLDDIVVYSADMESHLLHLDQVFKLLHDHSLRLNREKCSFAQSSIKFLGHLVDADGIRADPGKTKVVSEWPLPQTVTQLRSFIGSATYYKRFIQDFAKIASPLFTMLSGPKKQPVTWSTPARLAFEGLKAALTSPGVLVHPRPGLRFVLDTDASDIAVGGVLQQEDVPEQLVSAPVKRATLHPVAYESRKLTDTEQRYSAQEKELLAIRYSLEHFRGIIEGSPILVRTDHEPLKHLRTQKELGKRVRRFINDIEHFDPVIVYRPGHENIFADALSRRAGLPPSSADDTPLFAAVTALRNRSLPPPAPPVRTPAAVAPLAPAVTEPTSVAAAPEPTEPSSTAAAPASSVRAPTPPTLDAAAVIFAAIKGGEQRPSYILVLNDTALGFRHPKLGLVMVPTSKAALLTRLQLIHKDGGHFGADVTGHAAREQLWIDEKELARYVHHVVAVCEECQLAARGGDRSVFSPLHMMPRPQFLALWSFDFVGPLVVTRGGNSYLITAIEHVTNWPLAVALPARSAEAAVRLLETIVTTFGKPANVLTDNGAEFTSYAFTMALTRFGIKALHTSPYHPQTNGKVERFNAEIVNILRRLLAEPANETQWDLLLPAALLAYRAHPLTAHSKSPAMLMFGADPILPSRPIFDALYALPTDAEIEAIQQKRDDYVHDLNAIRQRAVDAHQNQRAQEVTRRNKSYVDQGFQVGDKVLRIKNDRKSKLEPFWVRMITERPGVLRTPGRQLRCTPGEFSKL